MELQATNTYDCCWIWFPCNYLRVGCLIHRGLHCPVVFPFHVHLSRPTDNLSQPLWSGILSRYTTTWIRIRKHLKGMSIRWERILLILKQGVLMLMPAEVQQWTILSVLTTPSTADRAVFGDTSVKSNLQAPSGSAPSNRYHSSPNARPPIH